MHLYTQWKVAGQGVAANRRFLAAVTIFALSASASFAGDLPQAAQAILEQLRFDVTTARKRAIDALERMKATEARRRNPAGENALQEKIVELGKLNFAETQAGAKQNAPADPETAAANGAALVLGSAAKVEIKANAKFGVQLGPVRLGQHVTLQYVDGRWNMEAEPDPTKWSSPDEAAYAPNRLGIYSLENGEARLLSGVPNGTKRHPFHFHFLKDYANVILRIQDDVPVDNPGSATYLVTLSQ